MSGPSNLQRTEGRHVISSYENVYDGVPLDPKINRMSGDASELDIGDRFDTKQTEQLQTSDRSSFLKLFMEISFCFLTRQFVKSLLNSDIYRTCMTG
jgi:hypothetical protein